MTDGYDDETMDAVDSILDNVSPADRHREALYELARCIRESTGAQGADLFAVEKCGLPAAKWADVTDRDRSTVARNVRRAND